MNAHQQAEGSDSAADLPDADAVAPGSGHEAEGQPAPVSEREIFGSRESQQQLNTYGPYFRPVKMQ